MKKPLLILMTLLTVLIGYSQTFTDALGIQYEITSATTVEIDDYNMTGGSNLIIPSTVTNNNTTYTVTSIGILAFQGNGLTSVDIPNSVTTLKLAAFQSNALTNVTIPNSVTTIGNNAFLNNDLESIEIPDSVTSIGQDAFKSNQIESIIIGSNVTSIGIRAFMSNQLTNITIPANVSVIGELAFGGNQLLTCIISEAITPPTITTNPISGTDSFATDRSNIDLTIPSSTANDYAAAQWSGFKSVAEGLTSTFVVNNLTYQINAFGNNAVTVTDYNTAGGSMVIIPSTVNHGCIEYNVTTIGNFAFLSSNLSTISIPTTIATIGTAAFRNNQLTSVTIPDSVFIIENGAFRDNPIMNLVLSSNLTTIGDEAFAFNNLQALTIPDSVQTIGVGAFAQNTNLTNVVIGDNVTSIGDAAFRYADLTSITIPASVTNIGFVAFGDNLSLIEIFSESTTPPTIITGVNDSFTNASIRANIHLHIPAGTMGAYVTDAGALWTGFNPVTEDALSVSDFQLANNITVVNTFDELQVVSSGAAKLENYTIYSITGSKTKTGNENTISINTLSNGIYILELNFNTGKLVKKFAK